MPSNLPEILETQFGLENSFVQIFRTVYFSVSYREGELHYLQVLAARINGKFNFAFGDSLAFTKA